MKRKKEKNEISTIIGDDVVIYGNIEANGNMSIDGIVYGDIISHSLLIINGQIEGNIDGTSLIIGGKVTGNINTYERCELMPNSVVRGDIITKSLVVDEGASFYGNCTMIGNDNKSEPDQAVLKDELEILDIN